MKNNPIRHTVIHFISAGKKRRRRKKKVEKSNFVKFMESLENRGPMTPNNLYEKLTKTVRAQMSEAGTWPTGLDEFKPQTIAEYYSRIQRVLWDQFPNLNCDNKNLYYDVWNEKHSDFRYALRTLEIIHKKLNRKGLRDRTFKIYTWTIPDSSKWTYIEARLKKGSNKWTTVCIKPFVPFCDHGAGI